MWYPTSWDKAKVDIFLSFFHYIYYSIMLTSWIWSIGQITDEMVQEYLEHYEHKPNSQSGNWIIIIRLEKFHFHVP
jgi:hypothetical protein